MIATEPAKSEIKFQTDTLPSRNLLQPDADVHEQVRGIRKRHERAGFYSFGETVQVVRVQKFLDEICARVPAQQIGRNINAVFDIARRQAARISQGKMQPVVVRAGLKSPLIRRRRSDRKSTRLNSRHLGIS